MRTIRQNYGLAVGVNSIGLVLAAAGRINPIIAAVLHNLSTMLVILNSARLIHYNPPTNQVLWPQPNHDTEHQS
jgi:cation-transporting P-type ATPase C